MSHAETAAICLTCGTTITAHDTAPCDVDGCPIPMPARSAMPVRGEFVRIDVAPDAQPWNVSSNPFAQFHAALVAELARIVVPKIGVNPLAEEIEDAADYWLRVMDAMDRWFKANGEELNRNATINVDMKCFDRTFRDAIEGFATFEADRVATAIREEHAEAEAESRRHDRGSDLADDLFKMMRNINRTLYGV